MAIELFEFAERSEALDGDLPRLPGAAEPGPGRARIAASGGRRTSRIWHVFPDAPYRTCYCEDPFGITIELYSHSHERTYANR